MAISFIGSAENSAANGGDVTVTLPGGMAADDIVVVGEKEGNSSGNGGISGYTIIRQDARFCTWRKFMPATPDSSFTSTGSGGTSNAHVVCCHVYRGVDTTTPLDQTTTYVEGSSTTPDSPSITTVTDGAAVVSAVTSGVSDTTVTAPTGFSDQIDRNHSDASPATVGIAWIARATAGAYDPPSWTNFSTGSWGAQSIALRPVTAVSTPFPPWPQRIYQPTQLAA